MIVLNRLNPYEYSDNNKRYYSLTYYKKINTKKDKYLTIDDVTNSLFNKKSKEYNLILKTNFNYLKRNLETINKLKIDGLYITEQPTDIDELV